MALKVKAKLTGLDKLQKKLSKLKRPVERSEAERIGTEVIAAMLALISRGQSTVIGNGFTNRMPAYKHASAPKKERAGKYPWSVMGKNPSKRVTPVNLRLKGKQLADLSYKVVTRPSGALGVDIGYPDNLSALKEEGHRKGVNSQPKRPTIPNIRSGESFASKVQQAYLKILNEAIKKIISS